MTNGLKSAPMVIHKIANAKILVAKKSKLGNTLVMLIINVNQVKFKHIILERNALITVKSVSKTENVNLVVVHQIKISVASAESFVKMNSATHLSMGILAGKNVLRQNKA